MRLSPLNISVTIAAICHGSGAGVAHVAVSLSNKAVLHGGQSLAGESRARGDGIGVIEGAALWRDRNETQVLFVLARPVEARKDASRSNALANV